jgi:hypothetical protein
MTKSVSELLKFRQLQGGFAHLPSDQRLCPGSHPEQSPQTPNIGLRTALAMNVVPHFSNSGYSSASIRFPAAQG